MDRSWTGNLFYIAWWYDLLWANICFNVFFSQFIHSITIVKLTRFSANYEDTNCSNCDGQIKCPDSITFILIDHVSLHCWKHSLNINGGQNRSTSVRYNILSIIFS